MVEGVNDEFDYSEVWEDQDKKETKKIVDEFSKGYPRQGLKGKYLKAKTGKVSNKRLRIVMGNILRKIRKVRVRCFKFYEVIN